MRLLCLCVCVLYVSSTAQVKPFERNLNSLWLEFWSVAKLDSVVKLLQEKLANNDPDMVEVDTYLKSPDFKAIADHMWTSQEYVDVSKRNIGHKPEVLYWNIQPPIQYASIGPRPKSTF